MLCLLLHQLKLCLRTLKSQSLVLHNLKPVGSTCEDIIYIGSRHRFSVVNTCFHRRSARPSAWGARRLRTTLDGVQAELEEQRSSGAALKAELVAERAAKEKLLIQARLDQAAATSREREHAQQLSAKEVQLSALERELSRHRSCRGRGPILSSIARLAVSARRVARVKVTLPSPAPSRRVGVFAGQSRGRCAGSARRVRRRTAMGG